MAPMSTHYETLPHADTYREAFAVDHRRPWVNATCGHASPAFSSCMQ